MDNKKISANYITNTGYRFISKCPKAFKIHIHMPDDSVCHQSIGFIRIGEDEALKQAIEMRDNYGRQAWGEFWPTVLNEPSIFIRMPHSFEPLYRIEKSSDGKNYCELYRVIWKDENGKVFCRKRSIKKYGKRKAYYLTKKLLLDAHQDIIKIMLYMGRITEKDILNRVVK